MNRAEFIRELEYLLQDISDTEREDAIAYYRDYLEEAGDEHEADAILEFGSPERVAAIIRADLAGQLEAGGDFTDSGYQDERFRDPRYQVAQRMDLPEEKEGDHGCAGRGQNTSGNDDADSGRGWGFRRGRNSGREEDPHPPRRTAARTMKVVLLLALLCILAPAVLGIGKSVMGMAALLCFFVIALVLLAGVLTIAALVGAVVVLIIGAGTLIVEFWTGIVWIGCGTVLLGLGLLGLAVSFLVYGKLIPWCICGIVNWISGFLHRGRRHTA